MQPWPGRGTRSAPAGCGIKGPGQGHSLDKSKRGGRHMWHPRLQKYSIIYAFNHTDVAPHPHSSWSGIQPMRPPSRPTSLAVVVGPPSPPCRTRPELGRSGGSCPSPPAAWHRSRCPRPCRQPLGPCEYSHLTRPENPSAPGVCSSRLPQHFLRTLQSADKKLQILEPSRWASAGLVLSDLWRQFMRHFSPLLPRAYTN